MSLKFPSLIQFYSASQIGTTPHHGDLAHACHTVAASVSLSYLADVKRSLYIEGMTASREQIVSSAERVFDHRGFAASGMDDLTAAAGVSTRTLYKHVGNKTGLVVAVLKARTSRFFAHCQAASVDELFVRLEEWVEAEGSRGCLFLRAHGEAGESTPEIAEEVAGYRAQLRSMIARIVGEDLGDDITVGEDDATVTQILVLFEGTTSTASYLGTAAVTSAREAAAILMNDARGRR